MPPRCPEGGISSQYHTCKQISGDTKAATDSPKATSLSPAVCSCSVLAAGTGTHVVAGETGQGGDLAQKQLRQIKNMFSYISCLVWVILRACATSELGMKWLQELSIQAG